MAWAVRFLRLPSGHRHGILSVAAGSGFVQTDPEGHVAIFGSRAEAEAAAQALSHPGDHHEIIPHDRPPKMLDWVWVRRDEEGDWKADFDAGWPKKGSEHEGSVAANNNEFVNERVVEFHSAIRGGTTRIRVSIFVDAAKTKAIIEYAILQKASSRIELVLASEEELRAGDSLVEKNGALREVKAVHEQGGKIHLKLAAYGPGSPETDAVVKKGKRLRRIRVGRDEWRFLAMSKYSAESAGGHSFQDWLTNSLSGALSSVPVDERKALKEWIVKSISRVMPIEDISAGIVSDAKERMRRAFDKAILEFAGHVNTAVGAITTALRARQAGEVDRARVYGSDAAEAAGRALASADRVFNLHSYIPRAELEGWAEQIRNLSRHGGAETLPHIGSPRGFKKITEGVPDADGRSWPERTVDQSPSPIKRVDNPRGDPGDGSVYKFVDRSGAEIEGFVQGGHGHLLIGRDGLHRLEEAREFAEAGRPLRIAEPVKGHVLLYPADTDWSKPFTSRPTLNVALAGKKIFLTQDEIHETKGFVVIEFLGTGDPAFGGKADDRPLTRDGRFQPAGRYNRQDVAVFPTRAEAVAAAERAEKRPGSRVSILAEKPDRHTARELQSVEGARAFIRRAMEAYRKAGVDRREAVRLAFDDAAREGYTAVPDRARSRETIYKGDRARYTGRTEEKHGGLFHELVLLEGHEKGKSKWTQKGPT